MVTSNTNKSKSKKRAVRKTSITSKGSNGKSWIPGKSSNQQALPDSNRH